jgi:endonuclease/exonuclease/phosphatase family metal-dependent hydrolase
MPDKKWNFQVRRSLNLIGSLLISSLLGAWLLFLSCPTAKNYLSPEGPKFSGAYGPQSRIFDDTLKIVSFNIKYAEKVGIALAELAEKPELQRADIILLQEMDDPGTEHIAKALGYNYVYYPATLHPQSEKNFGNAILSKWQLTKEKKILLPHEVAVAKTRRIAVAATVLAEQTEIRIYSVHTATIVLSLDKRLSQADSVLKSLSGDYSHIVIGGDFNTVFANNIQQFEEIFNRYGFERASESAGSTAEKGPFDFTLDHIFVKGFQVIQSGTVESEASDHTALWVILKKENYATINKMNP